MRARAAATVGLGSPGRWGPATFFLLGRLDFFSVLEGLFHYYCCYEHHSHPAMTIKSLDSHGHDSSSSLFLSFSFSSFSRLIRRLNSNSLYKAAWAALSGPLGWG